MPVSSESRPVRVGLIFLLGAGLAATAFAQDAPLAGPKVETRDLPGARQEYVQGASALAQDTQVPLGAFFIALREMNQTGPEDVRLGADQIQAVMDEALTFGRELERFLDAHGREVRDLIAALPQNERGRVAGNLRGLSRLGESIERFARAGLGAPSERRLRESLVLDDDERPGFRLDVDPMRVEPEGADDLMSAMRDGSMMAMEEGTGPRERLMALRNAAPDAGLLQSRVWSLLDDVQQAHFGAALDELRAELRARNEQQRLERDIQRRVQATADTAQQSAKRDTPRTTTQDAPSDRVSARPSPEQFAAGVERAAEGQLNRLLQALELGSIPQSVWDRIPASWVREIRALPESEQAEALAKKIRSLRGG